MYSTQQASQSAKMSNGDYGQARQIINDVAEEEETNFKEILAEEIEKTLQEQG